MVGEFRETVPRALRFKFYVLLLALLTLFSFPMFEAVKAQLDTAAGKLTHLRRFL